MELQTDISQLLEQMDSPAFCVSGGTIIAANHAARSRMVQISQPIAPLLSTGGEEYASFSGGYLYLAVEISSVCYEATVSKLSSADLFKLDPGQMEAELKALALASMELREPLNNIMVTADLLFPQLEKACIADAPEQAARINRGLYQLLRIVNNMSDAAGYSSNRPQMEALEITGFLAELFDSAQTLCEAAGVRLIFTNCPQTVYTMADPNRLERGIYNMLSNALKYTPAGTDIQAKLSRRGSMLYLTIQDSGQGIDRAACGSIFTRFLREPAIEDPRHGIGLGLTLVRSAASAHGGTVLLEPLSESGVRITMSLRIHLERSLRSPVQKIYSVASDRSIGLIELSESLPYALYTPDNAN